MADPLSQLRQFHIKGREIKELNGYIIFGDHGWPKNVQTNYQIYSSGSDTNKKEYYTLECLLYFLKNKGVTHTIYVRQAGSEDIPVVHRPDRKNLLAYLEGEAQTSPAIDKNAPIPSVRLPLSEIEKRSTQNSSLTSENQQRADDTSAGSASGGQSQHDMQRGISDDFSSPKVGGQKRPHDPEAEQRFREEFKARLNEPSNKKMATVISSEGAFEAGQSAEPSVAVTRFGAEKLAALKAKFTAVKRTTIVDADEVGKPGSGATDAAGKEDYLISMDAEKFKLIKSKEKVWRTRSTILQSQSKDFSKSILSMIDLLSKFENPNKKPTGQMPPVPTDLQLNPMFQQHPNAASMAAGMNSHQQQPAAQRNTYNRYDQERFVKLDIGVEIDTKKSFVSGVNNSLSNINQPATQQAAVAKPAAQPRLSGPPVGAVMTNNGHHHHHHHKPHDQVDHRHRSSTTPNKPTKMRSSVPIIIIPATTTSIINMYNVSTILQDLTYVDGQPGSRPRENELLIQRRKQDGGHAFYKIIDNPLKLDGEDWNRVVAVFVQGPAWQFKGWPWGGSPVEIFSRIKAFHLKWDEQKLDENVAKWNVHILELSRNKRHLDKANLLKFWSSLDAFMMKYKTFLKF